MLLQGVFSKLFALSIVGTLAFSTSGCFENNDTQNLNKSDTLTDSLSKEDSLSSSEISVSHEEVKKILENTNTDSTIAKNTNAPLKPTSLWLLTPSNSPAPSLAPIIRIGGTQKGNKVFLYTDNLCSKSIGFANSKGETTDVTTKQLTEGVAYTFWARNFDPTNSLFSSCSTANVSYLGDITAPTVSISSPAAGTYINKANVSAFTVAGTCSDNNGNVVISYGETATTALCVGGSWTKTLDLSEVAQGTVTVTADMQDLAENIAVQANVSYKKDTVAPFSVSGLSLQKPSTSPSNFTNPTITIFGTNSGDTITLYKNSTCTESVAQGISLGVTLNLNITNPLHEGTHQFFANATDVAGNRSACSTASLSYTVDNTVPNVSINTPTTPYINFENKSNFTITGTCTENSIPVYLSISGSQTTATCTNNVWTKNLDLSGTNDGVVTITSQQIDIAGNASAQISKNIVKDATPPAEITALVLLDPVTTPSNRSSPTIRVEGTENNVSVSLFTDSTCALPSLKGTATSGSSSVNITSSNLVEGIHQFYAKTTDEAGNSSACSTTSLIYEYDNMPPRVVILAPDPGTTINRTQSSSFTVSGTCTENGKNVTIATNGNTSQTLCNNGTWSADLNLTTVSDGDLILTASMIDGAGNQSVSDNRTYIKDTVDAPAVTTMAFNTIANNGYSSALSFILIGTGAEPESKLNIYQNSNTCNGTTSVTLDVSADGRFNSAQINLQDQNLEELKTIYYTTQDKAGNISTCFNPNLAFNFDKTAPVTTSFVINNGNISTNQMQITLNSVVTDKSPLQICADETGCGTCQYVNYNSSYPYTLSATNSTGTVYAKFKDAAGNETSCTSASITIEYLNVAHTYDQFSNWNDYVLSSDTTRVCDTTSTSSARDCIHAGDKLKVQTPYHSCSGLKMTDTLRAFSWTCDDRSGDAVFFSRLKSGKFLSDLIDFENVNIKNNSVELVDNNGGISMSSRVAAWWEDSVVLAPDTNSSGSIGALNSPDTIYILQNSSSEKGYRISASNLSFVSKPGTTLYSSDGSQTSLIKLDANQAFLWIEASLNGKLSTADFLSTGISLNSNQFVRLNNVKIANTLTAAIDLNLSHKNIFNNVTIANSSTNGIVLNNSNGNILTEIKINNSTNSGVITTQSNNNRFSRMLVTNSPTNGNLMISGKNNYVSAVTLAFGASGLNYKNTTGTVGASTFHNILAVNNQNHNIMLVDGKQSPNAISQFATGFGGQADVILSPANAFSSSGNMVLNSDLSNEFAGSITNEDTSNGSDNSSFATYDSDVDWFNFENKFRFWSPDVNSVANSNMISTCKLYGNCRIFDFTLASNANSVLLNHSDSLTNSNEAFIANASCPANVNGDITLNNSNGIQHLKNAIELLGDDDGNDNGLCETGERCLYTPNYGAYQGHDNLESCTFNSNGGAITGVTMFGFTSNGY